MYVAPAEPQQVKIALGYHALIGKSGSKMGRNAYYINGSIATDITIGA
jgi:hypothetical protein